MKKIKWTKKKIIIIGGIIIFLGVCGYSSSNYDNNSTKKSPTAVSINKEKQAVTTPKHDDKNSNDIIKPLGTQAEKGEGKIYVSIGKNIKGIVGIGAEKNSLLVLPNINESGNYIGSYAYTYYNPNELTNESLAEFCNVIEKSKYNYISLINSDNPKEGIEITANGQVLSKGNFNNETDYTISTSTQSGFLSNNKQTIEWSNN